MLDSVQLTYFTPATEAELEPWLEWFEFFYSFVPVAKFDKHELKAIAISSLGSLTFVKANGIPLGCFILDCNKKSVELHGIVRKDCPSFVPNYRRVKLFIYKTILDAVFLTLNKQKIIMKAHPTNTDVKGFAWLYGFKALQYLDKGERVYILKREDYLDGKKSTESQS